MPTTVVAVFTRAPMVVAVRPALVKIVPARKSLKISLGDFITMTCSNFSTNLLFKYAPTVARKTTNATTIM